MLLTGCESELHVFPHGQFQGEPVTVRLGKMSSTSQADDHSEAGPSGSCRIKDLRVFGRRR
ncbi:MAG: hypothetical protein ACLQNE_02495 [Thermoguttaceae bacterium]